MTTSLGFLSSRSIVIITTTTVTSSSIAADFLAIISLIVTYPFWIRFWVGKQSLGPLFKILCINLYCLFLFQSNSCGQFRQWWWLGRKKIAAFCFRLDDWIPCD